MNKIELVIYNYVKDNPKLKQKIVDIYQSVLGLIPQKKIKTELPYVNREGYFFGFHDKTPFSNNGKLLLTHKVVGKYKELSNVDAVEVGYFKGGNWKEYVKIGKTLGWNWQLGSMLQWVGDSNEEVVFNTMDNDELVSSIVNIKSNKEKKKLPWAVSHVSPNGKYACSYNFFRVEKAMPGYGLIKNKRILNNEETDFFRIFDIETNLELFKISLESIKKINPHPSMEGAFHFFHHSLFNPNSKRVFFLHRWVDKNERRWTRMFSVGINGVELYLFPMDEMVSHITWASDTEIFAYLRYPNDGEGYYLVEDLTGKQERFFKEDLNSDGHPTYDKRRGVVITDTYPDRFRNQYLVLMDINNKKRNDLCRTHLPKKFKRFLQVDLHPRVHPKQNIVCFDTGYNGKRNLVTIDYTNTIK